MSAPDAALRSRFRRFLPFLIWLAAFYVAWGAAVWFGARWSDVVAHWPIAVAMTVGSYVAGSTPLGGGTVGFPILVLLLDQPATIGRDFSFAVQSIGMVSATIFILVGRWPLERQVLAWALAGTTVGTPLGTWLLAPHVSDLAIKLVFAVLWCSFGVMHLYKVREIVGVHGMTPTTRRFDARLGFTVGFAGGATIAAVTGVGVDMLVYTALVLVARADLRIAIPTSVIVMAHASVVGILSRIAFGDVDPEVWSNWFAAAPIVVLGAPCGALMVRLIPRAVTLVIVSLLCIGQFAWTCVHERVGPGVFVAALAGVVAFQVVFHMLYTWGRRRAAA